MFVEADPERKTHVTRGGMTYSSRPSEDSWKTLEALSSLKSLSRIDDFRSPR